MSQRNRKINQELFENVPSEIVIEILSRLPVRSIISCKCAQKSWLHLVETQEFVNSHLSKSTPGLFICQNPSRESNLYKFYEIQDGFDVEHDDLHCRLVTKFTRPSAGMIMGSADGLLFLGRMSASETRRDALYICNPITRDYINLHCPPEFGDGILQLANYGFGSSKKTKQYKVVRIFERTYGWQESFETECYVYTLGTGSWRRHASCDLPRCRCRMDGVFVNGNLHWLVCDSGIGPFLRISYFDLETEQFNTFYPPPLPWNDKYKSCSSVVLFALGDYLGICDNTSGYEIIIWVMKEYGIETSWIKELILSNDLHLNRDLNPIKVFKDGDVLFQWNEFHLVYYSSKYKTTRKVDVILPKVYDAFLHSPSFLSLKSFGLENVSSL